MSVFDYYQASVEASPDVVIPAMQERFDMSSVDGEKATNGYERACLIHRGDRRLVTVQWGGNTGDMTQIKGTGSDAPLVADAIRDLFPVHRLQRADVAEDFSEPDVFQVLTSHAIHLSTHYRLKISQMGDWARDDAQGKGRTLYVGSRQSLAFLRVYEKGKEKAVRSGSDCIDSDHARAEVEIKPQNVVQGVELSKRPPRDFWRCSPFLNEYSKILFTHDMERIRLHTVKRVSDDEMAFQFMLKQYSGVMARMAMANGSDWVTDSVREALEKAVSEVLSS